jgi:hypothetical protein
MGSEGTIQGKLHGTLKSNDILIENESNVSPSKVYGI